MSSSVVNSPVIMTSAWKLTIDPENMTSFDASGNFIPDKGLMILVGVPVWVEPILSGALHTVVNAIHNH
jgi:hypothetical protein